MGLGNWFRKLNKELDLHKKIIPIIIICFAILIVLTVIVTSSVTYYFGLENAKNVLMKRELNFVENTLIKHGELLKKMQGDPVKNYRLIRDEFLGKEKDVRIIRSEKVDELYGKDAPQYYPQNELEKLALEEGKKIIVRHGEFLNGVFPIRAQKTCLKCHYNVAPGEVIGAVSIRLPIDYLFKEIKFIVPLYIFLGLGGILTASILVYLTYIKIAHKPLEKVTETLDKVAEGDLTVKVEEGIKDREDLIGRLAKSTDRVLDYMKNFSSKTLDYSVKLVEQVDDIFKMVDNTNEKIKFQTLRVAQTAIVVDDFGLTVGEISRHTSNINTIGKEFKNLAEDLEKGEKESKEIVPQLLNLTDQLRDEALKIASNIEKGVKTSEAINQALEEINAVSNEISQLMDKMSEYAYETLLISSYMKTIASTVKTEKMEDLLFDLFEKDVDRYLLRLQAHVKGIDRLDPERWGDYKAFPIGKWYYSEEGEKFRAAIKDFDFDEFENTYKTLHKIGKEIINAYDAEDLVKVEKLMQQLRAVSRRFKLLLDEMKDKYAEYLEKIKGSRREG